MIAIDTNLLVYAHRVDSPWHAPADRCLRELAEGSQQWAIPWPCVHEFLCVVTHTKVYKPPTPIEKSLEQIEIWMESPTLQMIGEAPGYWPTLRANIVAGRITGGAVHDARIAAICRVHAVKELWTADRDFSRYPNIKTKNPLV